ncbi:uncharacterized protein LOC121718969 isoform X2 [Alosa sapidissima]|nr:uncharacterized protein LOC121718969 isoform X2 [Alosa sapidissima]XP_041960380.1 uncharacterized protein LOC121718969 isoform X2 [Alosa sapidissima]
MEQPCPQPTGLSGEQQVALLGQIVEQVDLKEEEQQESQDDVQAPQSIPQQEGGEETALNAGPELEPASNDAPSTFPVPIESLLLRPFSLRSPEEKKDIVARGRPTPDLKMIHCFNSWHYSRIPWLTGCPKSNQLYCWPCSLFSAESLVWTTGFCDLTDLPKVSEQHESSFQHISNMMQLHTLKHERHIRQSVSTQAELSAEQQDKHRQILKVLTEAAIILGSRQYNPLFEEEDSEEEDEDLSAFVKLVKSLVKDNDRLATHIDPDSFFSGLSDDLEDRLTESVE